RRDADGSTAARWARLWARRRRARIGRLIVFVGRRDSAAVTSAFGRWNGNRWKNRKPRCCAKARREALLFASVASPMSRGCVAAGTLNQFERLRTSASMADLRSEEHTSELQSLTNLVCRLLLEKKNNTKR